MKKRFPDSGVLGFLTLGAALALLVRSSRRESLQKKRKL